MINSNEKETNVMNFIKNLLVQNCNKIENKIQDLFYTLDNECIDIIALNETKLDKNNEALIMSHPNYKYVLCKINYKNGMTVNQLIDSSNAIILNKKMNGRILGKKVNTESC